MAWPGRLTEKQLPQKSSTASALCSLYNLTTGSIMAPFLRISFNSYELGSLQAEDEASQPFCAVKMKEALSTGRAGRVPRGAQGSG